jgi:Transposase DDE domain
MSPCDTIAHWQREISRHLPHLSRPQATVLALWSYGMVLTKSCGITTVVSFLARLLGWPKGNLRQRLREWCYDAADKKGEQRAELDLGACFAPLLGWIISWWAGEERSLALALDATHLSDRFTVLAVSVHYRGCAIPVAWQIMSAHAKGSWRPIWERLLTQLAPAVPPNWRVIVMADRGLYASWLYEQIVALGWHPFLRVNNDVKIRPVDGDQEWQEISAFVGHPGERWAAEVECGQEERLRAHLLIQWEVGYEECWIIATDLPQQQTQVAWYSMRFWIEGGFKDQKRGGWQWHHTKMRDPRRAGRLWVVMAVATLWVVSVGGQAEAEEEAESRHEEPQEEKA